MVKKIWAMPSDVQAVHTQIESWRENRRKRGAVPSSIWFAASRLAKRYGVYRISQALRLNYGALKRRVSESAAEGTKKTQSNLVTGGRCDFIELKDVASNGVSIENAVSEEINSRSSGVTCGMEIEVSDSSGSRMTVRVMEHGGVDITKVISTFWSQSR